MSESYRKTGFVVDPGVPALKKSVLGSGQMILPDAQVVPLYNVTRKPIPSRVRVNTINVGGRNFAVDWEVDGKWVCPN